MPVLFEFWDQNYWIMENEQGRNKGVRKDDGKIIKGTLKQAPLKLKASSIPSKVENVVYNNHHKAAFGNSTERFYTPTNQKLSATPGPGNYANETKLYQNVSSKKGFGFFASQTAISRFNDRRNWNPGPGKYELEDQNKKVKSNSSYFRSTAQSRQLFKTEVATARQRPGPGNYQQRLFRSSSMAAPVFKSKKDRFANFQNNTPGVGAYDWEKVKNKIKALKFSKENSSVQSLQKSFQQKYLEKILGSKLDPKKELGPGKYNPSLLESKRTFSIKDDHKDRFATTQKKLPKREREQDPVDSDDRGHAKVVNAHVSVFESKTRRYQFGQVQSKILGDPWKYSPSKFDKSSYLINFAKRWV